MRMATLFAAGAVTIAAFVAVPAAQSTGTSAPTSVLQVSTHDCQYRWNGRSWRYRHRGAYYNWRWNGRFYRTRFRCRRMRGGWCYR